MFGGRKEGSNVSVLLYCDVHPTTRLSHCCVLLAQLVVSFSVCAGGAPPGLRAVPGRALFPNLRFAANPIDAITRGLGGCCYQIPSRLRPSACADLAYFLRTPVSLQRQLMPLREVVRRLFQEFVSDGPVLRRLIICLDLLARESRLPLDWESVVTRTQVDFLTSARTFHGLGVRRVHQAIANVTTAPAEDWKAGPSRACVLKAMLVNKNSSVKARDVNCHALLMATVMIFEANPGSFEFLQIKAGDHHLQLMHSLRSTL